MADAQENPQSGVQGNPQPSEQENPQLNTREDARKAYERAKALSHGLTARDATRTAIRMSKWANPSYAQWSDINKTVTKEMIKEVWPCSEGEIKKGRWKVGKCRHDGIKQHAERIFLEINGHPLHNADAPLYFAKMLYMHFIMGQPVDFASREAHVHTHDIREETVTFTRQELALMIEGAGLELARVKENLEAKLAEKEQESARLSQVQTPPPLMLSLKRDLTRFIKAYKACHNV